MARSLILTVIWLAAACRAALNYTSAVGPRYVGGVVAAPGPGRRPPDTLRVVTFNIKYAKHVDRAVTLLESAPSLRNADILILQEMDAPGTERIAAALGMAYVYYPATLRFATDRDFGNAILSRWPIVADEKIILPHQGRFNRTQRIAVAATVAVGETLLRVYSVHLATVTEVGPGARRNQAGAVIADAAAYPRVIVAGDMNAKGIGHEFRRAGFLWPTADNPATNRFLNLDHVFVRGIEPASVAGAGVVRDNLGASDHRPVWVLLRLGGAERH